jgi:hypothetical protein
VPALSLDGCAAEISDRQRGQAEERAAADLARKGRSPLGAARVLARNPNARPAPGEPRRNLSPRNARRNKRGRIEAHLRLADFGRAYREALRAWRAGVRDVSFPPGTWLMRVQHLARCGALC